MDEEEGKGGSMVRHSEQSLPKSLPPGPVKITNQSDSSKRVRVMHDLPSKYSNQVSKDGSSPAYQTQPSSPAASFSTSLPPLPLYSPPISPQPHKPDRNAPEN